MYQNRFFFFFAITEAGDPSKRKPYLPSEKQFLITRNGKVEFFSVQFEVFLLCIVVKFVAFLYGLVYSIFSYHFVRQPPRERRQWGRWRRRENSLTWRGFLSPEVSFFLLYLLTVTCSFSLYTHYYHPAVLKCFLLSSLWQATLQSNILVAQEPDDDSILRTRTYNVSIT